MAHDHSEHGFAHPASIKMLLAVFFSLVFLTVVTLLLAGNLGPFGFAVAMIIATAKGALVMAFFMHMAWDKPFNILVFFSSLFFLFLFIGMTVTDTDANQDSIDVFPREAETSTP